MSRIAIPTREDAPAKSQPTLDAVEKQLGVVPNLNPGGVSVGMAPRRVRGITRA